MIEEIRWGILGTGAIAKKFADGLKHVPGAKVMAVGSRQQATADAFGDKYGAPHRYASYAGVAEDADVDVVYVATPHNLHKDNTLLCLHAGKAVLCEKPFCINAAEARAMVQLARAKRLFLMEAMWTRYLPVMVKVRELLADGAVGDIRMVMADFGFRAGYNEESRLLNPHLGGGGLLDVGVYTVSFASMVLGKPSRIVSMADIGKTGVDEQCAMVLGYDGGRLAVLAAAVRTNTPHIAYVLGTDGRIFVHPPFWVPKGLTLVRSGKEDQVFELPYIGNGYNYEAQEVQRCLSEGKLESDIMPLDESIAIMETLDHIRAPWGLKYPME